MKESLQLFIFCYSLSHGKGGAEKTATNLINEMAARGHQLYVGFQGGGREPAYTIDERAKLVPWHDPKESVHDYRERVAAISPDAFFAFYFSQKLILYRKIVWGTSIPFGMQECTNPERLCSLKWLNDSGRTVRSAWERELVASSAARVRLVMPGYETSFPPYIRQNVRAFPNAAPADMPRARPWESGDGEKRIITIGGLKVSKNLPLLIRGFGHIKKEFPDWTIHCYGKDFVEDHPYHSKIGEEIQTVGLQEQVVFHGPTDDLHEEYFRSHLHVLTSLSEGCPNCVLEAMGQGLPSIGISSCQGTNRLIQHEKNGLLVENDESGRSLSHGLRQLMSSPEMREKMGKKAYQDSLDFQPEKTYDRWENLFYEMAKYKTQPGLLLDEQMMVDKERALHMERCSNRFFAI